MCKKGGQIRELYQLMNIIILGNGRLQFNFDKTI